MHEQGYCDDSTVMLRAAQHGHLQCLEYVMEHNFKIEPNFREPKPHHKIYEWQYIIVEEDGPEHPFVAAVEGGHTECAVYLMQHIPCNEYLENGATKAAARRGDMSTLKFWQGKGGAINSNTMAAALRCKPCNNEIIEYVMSSGVEWCDWLSTQAIENNAIDVLKKYCDTRKTPFKKEHIEAANTAECLQYLQHRVQFAKTPEVFRRAIQHGRLDCLWFAVENEFPCEKMDHAAGVTRDCLEYLDSKKLFHLVEDFLHVELCWLKLSCIKYLVEIKGWDPPNFTKARSMIYMKDDIESIKYFHQLFCFGDGTTLIKHLIIKGDIKCLRWALNAYPNADHNAFMAEALDTKGDSAEVMRVLEEHGVPFVFKKSTSWNYAKMGGMKMARNHGVTWSEATIIKCQPFSTRAFRFLLRNGALCSEATMTRLLKYGYHNYKLYRCARKFGFPRPPCISEEEDHEIVALKDYSYYFPEDYTE